MINRPCPTCGTTITIGIDITCPNCGESTNPKKIQLASLYGKFKGIWKSFENK